jgi:hypothetical protein
MPKAKAVETVGKVPDTTLLRMGKANNVIQWREDMYNLATEEFGEVGTYFYTNVGYKYHERDYNPFYVKPVEETIIEEAEAVDEVDEDDEVIADDVEDIGVVVANEPAPPPDLPDPADLPDATRVALINKLREGAYADSRTAHAWVKVRCGTKPGCECQRNHRPRSESTLVSKRHALTCIVAMDRHSKNSPHTHIW